MLLLNIAFLRLLFRPDKNPSAGWLAEGLRNENNGHYEKAVSNYENALIGIKKKPAYLKNKILAKLKVLHTVIQYQNNFHRQDKTGG